MATTPKSKANKAAETPSDPTVEVSPVSAWKKNVNEPLTLPSGNVIRIRNVGFQAFIKAGIIPNSLMSTVESAVSSGQAPDVGMLESQDENLSDMFELIDEVMLFVAIEPKVHRIPMKGGENGKNEEDFEARSDDLLYVDEISDEDKQFVFNITTGGTRDVEQFRREQANGVDAVQRGREVAPPAK